MTEDITQVTLSPNALKRLARLSARAEGANAAAMAAMNAATQAHTTLQEALAEECEYEGMAVPTGGQGQALIDWRSGVVRLQLPPTPPPPAAGPLPYPTNGLPAPAEVEAN